MFFQTQNLLKHLNPRKSWLWHLFPKKSPIVNNAANEEWNPLYEDVCFLVKELSLGFRVSSFASGHQRDVVRPEDDGAVGGQLGEGEGGVVPGRKV